jgi:hypothetical protein
MPLMAMNDIRAFSPEWQAQSKIAEWQRMAKEKNCHRMPLSERSERMPLNAIKCHTHSYINIGIVSNKSKNLQRNNDNNRSLAYDSPAKQDQVPHFLMGDLGGNVDTFI